MKILKLNQFTHSTQKTNVCQLQSMSFSALPGTNRETEQTYGAGSSHT